jgi:hypothetical protein
MKIFQLGMSNTGSHTLSNLFGDQFRVICNQKWQGDLKNLKNNYDVFLDGNTTDFKMIDNLFPDARFILTTQDNREWLRERITHIHRDYPKVGQGRMGREYNSLPLEELVEKWVKQKEDYEESVHSYFENRVRKLFTLDLNKDNYCNKICYNLDMNLYKYYPHKPPIILNEEGQKHINSIMERVDEILKKIGK